MRGASMISEFPLFVFTMLGGLAAGAYIAAAAFPLSGERKRPWLFPLVCLILLGLGLIGVLFHLGRPMMFLNGLANPSAGIAQEAYFSIVFGILLLIDLIITCMKGKSPRALQIAGAIVALGLTIVMGMAYTANYGVPAWTSPVTVLLFVVGDLAMGAALLAVFDGELPKKNAFAIALGVLGIVAAVVFAAEAAHFSGVGADIAAVIAGAVIAAVGGVLAFVAKSGKIGVRVGAWIVLACMLVGVACARWGFYAACAL